MQDELTENVLGAAIKVHRQLGPSLLESIYEQALYVECTLRGLSVQRQKPIDVIYKGHVIKGQVIDLIVNDEVIIELKCVTRLPDVATAQLFSYLRAARKKRGLLINFAQSRLMDGVKRLSL